MRMENLVKAHIGGVDEMCASMLTCCNAQLRNAFPPVNSGDSIFIFII